MDVRIKILIGAPTSVLGALGIRGARITLTPRQKRKHPRSSRIYSNQKIFYFFTLAEAREELENVLAAKSRTKIKILRRLRRAGLFWDMEAIRSYCQKLAVTEDATYSFVKCTRCTYASLVPHGWIMTEGNRLIETSMPQLLHQQVTNLKDLIFMFCSEGVLSDEIPLKAALWVIRQGAISKMSTNSKDLPKLLRQPQVQNLGGRPPTEHSICYLTAPST